MLCGRFVYTCMWVCIHSGADDWYNFELWKFASIKLVLWKRMEDPDLIFCI